MRTHALHQGHAPAVNKQDAGRDRPPLQRQGGRTRFPAREPELEEPAGRGPAAGRAPSAIQTTEPRVTLDRGGELPRFPTAAGARALASSAVLLALQLPAQKGKPRHAAGQCL